MEDWFRLTFSSLPSLHKKGTQMTLPDDYLNIDTPENVAFGYSVAGIGSRFLAALVDTLLILILQIIVNMTLFLAARSFWGNLRDSDSQTLIWVAAIFGLIAFAFFWGYYIFFEIIWNGQSPGKRWVGLRVIRTNGTPITLAESVIRNLVRVIDFLPAYYGVGVVTMFINEQSRRLGDLAAGTLVVYDKATISLDSLAEKSAWPRYSPTPALAADWPINRLSYQDVQMAEDFLRRRYELTNRAALAEQIAQTLRQRMELPPQPINGQEAEDFVREVVQACRKRASEV
jgi:uncharacterized RDD family membrane protein YckC